MAKIRKAETGVFDDIGTLLANLDLERVERCGSPEAIYASGKTPKDTVSIAATLREKQGYALITRAGTETMAALRVRWPGAKFSERAGAVLVGKIPEDQVKQGSAVIVAAGTSDLGVAEEAALTLDALGVKNSLVTDVGVAGIHRLLKRMEDIRSHEVVIAVAGMEGALPGVIAGLVSSPVIAVPTSVGYGASLAGLSALLGMLNSCAPGLAVVNIDNGFGAAVMAARILAVKSNPAG